MGAVDDFPNNFETYEIATRKYDWERIDALNDTTLGGWRLKALLSELPNLLLESEVVFALATGTLGPEMGKNPEMKFSGVGLLVLTNERLLIVGEMSNNLTIRHSKIQAISATEGFFLAKVLITLGGRVIVFTNCEKKAAKVIVKMANKWQSTLETQNHKDGAEINSNSTMNDLEKLVELYKSGMLSEEEFSLAKKKIIE